MEKVMIGMSGGVDSSVAAAVLKDKGYTVYGATLDLYRAQGDTAADINDAALVCKKLGIEHFVFDFSSEFKQTVVKYFIDAYKNGLTPNPCIVCNKLIKFDALIKKAQQKDIPFIATGHYSAIKKDSGSGRMLLLRPADPTKDQTYVLYRLSQSQLERTKMPLADYTKEQIRDIARNLDLANADRPDSQDICFIPDGDYAGFIENYTGEKSISGDYIDQQGTVIGKHKGIIHYTIGQRKGLGIALGKPAFVIDKNAQTNKVVIGDEASLMKKRVEVNSLNFIPFETLTGSIKVKAKLRYRHTEQDATVTMVDKDKAVIEFKESVRAPSPGQSAVFYDGNVVVGGGIII